MVREKPVCGPFGEDVRGDPICRMSHENLDASLSGFTSVKRLGNESDKTGVLPKETSCHPIWRRFKREGLKPEKLQRRCIMVLVIIFKKSILTQYAPPQCPCYDQANNTSRSREDFDGSVPTTTDHPPSVRTPNHSTDTLAPHNAMTGDLLCTAALFERPKS